MPDKVTLDDFFSKHKAAPLRATLEEVGASDIKLTPWRSGAGCLCDAALTLPRTVIESVTPTDDSHECCEHTRRVCIVEFDADVRNLLSSIFGQLISTASMRSPAQVTSRSHANISRAEAVQRRAESCYFCREDSSQGMSYCHSVPCEWILGGRKAARSNDRCSMCVCRDGECKCVDLPDCPPL